ncbi:hypothetical protein A0H81_07291 [Grifola frondosa]|uniref:Uncharacterized protein n=1 Tax=Grifola frondosa TaxID=5627 RepID=A0A1C7M9B7_GRIFR|nr:hypothetical protein A0H81_07291 [Grifola frondosa]
MPAERDIEAQVGVYPQSSPVINFPVQPPTSFICSPRTSLSLRDGTDPVDDFFGVTTNAFCPAEVVAGTRDSRHDDPPPYVCTSEPPEYTPVSAQPTLAMYLFKLGFLFPPFWILGSLILLTPLAAPADWEPSKSEVERQELIASMRRTEMKWAKRSLVSLSVLVLVILVIVLAIVFA